MLQNAGHFNVCGSMEMLLANCLLTVKSEQKSSSFCDADLPWLGLQHFISSGKHGLILDRLMILTRWCVTVIAVLIRQDSV